ncbi:MAG TPA: flagellar hook-associated protein FlgK [Bryobacteraceae bacterium]|jgi:flagellar hook-associated protein 1 FlgK|nr:flagellar hook-associated protein FlgK [Bryobacteraceae bacterium]
MSNFLASLGNTASSFAAIEQAMEVVSNNTTNATTPGYASQTEVLQADPFDPSQGAIGGVSAGPIVSSRDIYAEMNVQTAQSALNYSTTVANTLQSVVPLFSLTTNSSSDTSIGGTLNALFASFSNLSVSPNDSATRSGVLNAASNVAAAFNSTYQTLASTAQNTVTDAQSTVASINSLTADIQQINAATLRSGGGPPDPGSQAQLYSDLENLSQLANITFVNQQDGTTSVYLGGQSTLVSGTTQYAISSKEVASSSNTQGIQILDSNGNDVTHLATGGQLGALVNLSNNILPGYTSQLNTLAQGVADQVNTQLTSGKDQTGAAGQPLFSYNAASAAHSLAFTGITASQLAAASSSAPGGNDNALALQNLQSSLVASLGGATFTQYYADLGSKVGSDSSNSSNNETTQQQLLSQAQSLRSNVSGVSLDQQATLLTEYQQSYDAISKLISVVNQMAQTVIGLIPGTVTNA